MPLERNSPKNEAKLGGIFGLPRPNKDMHIYNILAQWTEQGAAWLPFGVNQVAIRKLWACFGKVMVFASKAQILQAYPSSLGYLAPLPHPEDDCSNLARSCSVPELKRWKSKGYEFEDVLNTYCNACKGVSQSSVNRAPPPLPRINTISYFLIDPGCHRFRKDLL